jgi:hypothetical protein
MSVKCLHCDRKSTLFLCQACVEQLHKTLTDMPWWLDRLAETSIGQARLGEPGRRGHRAGLEKYADPKPAVDGTEKTEGQRRLEQDLEDAKLRARLLAQGGVNAHASDLFDDVQNMLGSWVRDVCERRGLYWVDPSFIGPLRANEMRFSIHTASGMAIWLRDRVPALASAECAEECFRDIHNAAERMERAVNKPPEPKTCGPCPTPGEHTNKGFVMAEVRSKCATRLEARANAVDVRCPVCKQTHNVEDLIERLINETHYTCYTIPELCQVVLPRLKEPIPQQTLQRWYAKKLLEPRGHTTTDRGKTIPQFMLADVRRVKHQMSIVKRGA